MDKSAAFVLAALVAGAAYAHEHATGIIADRMKAMTNMGRELKAIGDMLTGNVPFDAEALRQHADVLHENCHHVESMFPPGSIDHHSHARPMVWEKPVAFHEEMQKLHEETESLVALAASGDRDRLTASFKTIRDTCNSCHDTFRIPEH